MKPKVNQEKDVKKKKETRRVRGIRNPPTMLVRETQRK
jgi:hypothetical protein